MQGPKWPFLLILIIYEPDVVMRLIIEKKKKGKVQEGWATAHFNLLGHDIADCIVTRQG